MSLPSLKEVATLEMTTSEREDILYAAIQKDLPLAFAWFEKIKTGVHCSENPSSELGAQIKRIVSDGMRSVLEKKLFAGKKIVFANCCDVIVDPPEGFCPVLFQFQTQNGALNYADC